MRPPWRSPYGDGIGSESEPRRRSVGAEALTWIIIIGGSVSAAIGVVALYNALIENQAEPVEQIIDP